MEGEMVHHAFALIYEQLLPANFIKKFYKLFDEGESGSSQILGSDMIQRIWLEPEDPQIK